MEKQFESKKANLLEYAEKLGDQQNIPRLEQERYSSYSQKTFPKTNQQWTWRPKNAKNKIDCGEIED